LWKSSDDWLALCSVPPQFIIEPRSQTVSQGQTVTLDCVADGDPDPDISWRKGRTSLPSASLGQRFTVLHNDSLRYHHSHRHASAAPLQEAQLSQRQRAMLRALNISLSHSRSFKIIRYITIPKLAYSFLFAFYSNYIWLYLISFPR